mgnify:CR=1 FL=1
MSLGYRNPDKNYNSLLSKMSEAKSFPVNYGKNRYTILESKKKTEHNNILDPETAEKLLKELKVEWDGVEDYGGGKVYTLKDEIVAEYSTEHANISVYQELESSLPKAETTPTETEHDHVTDTNASESRKTDIEKQLSNYREALKQHKKSKNKKSEEEVASKIQELEKERSQLSNESVSEASKEHKCPKCGKEMAHSTLTGEDYYWCPTHGKKPAKESVLKESGESINKLIPFALKTVIQNYLSQKGIKITVGNPIESISWAYYSWSASGVHEGEKITSISLGEQGLSVTGPNNSWIVEKKEVIEKHAKESVLKESGESINKLIPFALKTVIQNYLSQKGIKITVGNPIESISWAYYSWSASGVHEGEKITSISLGEQGLSVTGPNNSWIVEKKEVIEKHAKESVNEAEEFKCSGCGQMKADLSMSVGNRKYCKSCRNEGRTSKYQDKAKESVFGGSAYSMSASSSSDQKKYQPAARGISDKDTADQFAQEEGGVVSNDDQEKDKFMVIKTEESKRTCPDCDGTGFLPDTERTPCPGCHERGIQEFKANESVNESEIESTKKKIEDLKSKIPTLKGKEKSTAERDLKSEESYVRWLESQKNEGIEWPKEMRDQDADDANDQLIHDDEEEKYADFLAKLRSKKAKESVNETKWKITLHKDNSNQRKTVIVAMTDFKKAFAKAESDNPGWAVTDSKRVKESVNEVKWQYEIGDVVIAKNSLDTGPDVTRDDVVDIGDVGKVVNDYSEDGHNMVTVEITQGLYAGDELNFTEREFYRTFRIKKQNESVNEDCVIKPGETYEFSDGEQVDIDSVIGTTINMTTRDGKEQSMQYQEFDHMLHAKQVVKVGEAKNLDELAEKAVIINNLLLKETLTEKEKAFVNENIKVELTESERKIVKRIAYEKYGHLVKTKGTSNETTAK